MESDILWNYWLLRVAGSSEGPFLRMWPLIKRVLTQSSISFPFTAFKLPVQQASVPLPRDSVYDQSSFSLVFSLMPLVILCVNYDVAYSPGG